MAGTRKARVPMAEQIRLINECRQSGMTDADWCRENNIAVSTFYNWVSRCRKAAADQIPAANYGHGLYIPMKKKIFNGAYLKRSEWLTGLPDEVKKVCLLVGQWTGSERICGGWAEMAIVPG